MKNRSKIITIIILNTIFLFFAIGALRSMYGTSQSMQPSCLTAEQRVELIKEAPRSEDSIWPRIVFQPPVSIEKSKTGDNVVKIRFGSPLLKLTWRK